MANPALIDELEKQFRDNPRRVFARLANEYRKAGDFMRAIEICHAHVPQQPGYISGHIVLGQALYDAGELDQAQQTFQTALSLDPENLIALRQLGDIARSRRDYREARSWYTRLLEVDPQNDEIVAQLGEIALAEGDDAGRSAGATHASSEAEEEPGGVAMATAIEDEDEDRVAEPDVTQDAPDESSGMIDPHSHNDLAARLDAPRLDHPSADHEPTPEFTEVQELEPEPTEFSIDAGEPFPEEHAFARGGHTAPAPDASASREPDDDDVAWIEAESERVDTVDFIVSDPGDADGTEFVIAEAAQDDEESLAPPTDDFDFAFETEEFEEPLRPHTGESLSIIAEEDALAGVQSTHVFDRSPFGEPIGVPGPAEPEEESESAEASFEPMPAEDLEAASAELPPVEELGGEDLIDEMTRWSSNPPDTGADPVTSERHEAPDVAHADAFLVSEAETIIGETIVSETILDEHNDAGMAVEDAMVTAGWDPPGEADAPDAVPVSEQGAGSTKELGETDYGDEIDALFSSAESAQPTDAASAADSPIPDAHPEAAPASGDDAATTDAPEADAAPATFVTETMAELYLQQGFRNEALQVYRKLAAQSPDDSALRDRIAELEQPSASSATHREADEPDREPVPAMRRSAAAFFKSLASVEPPPPPPPDDDASEREQWDAMLSDAGEVSPGDDAAAVALSNGFHPPEQPRGAATRAADSRMSLQDIFGGADQSDRGASAGSLDAFFTPEGERTNSPQGDEEGREDLEAFNAWLEGLKK